MSTDPSDAVQAQERQLRLAQARAEEGSRARIAFLANMSHEIRTPLTAILGFAETLGERLTGHDLELVRIIQRNGEQLVQLISDVLDIALAESGSLPINVCACDATRVLTDISDRMRIRAEGKGVAFCVEIDADVPHYVRADPV
ncbi:MAG: hypothetical protein KDJ28_19210, partial [Candidatus Competibacteraceae bacterium]|nr:hypothetical protein [Candidatus Competibacteraceae bacterium]